MTAQKSWRKLLATATTGLLVASGVALAPTMAQADDVVLPASISGATLDWGVKTSFRNDNKSPIAHGSVSLIGSATQNDTGTSFGWANGTGSSLSNGTNVDLAFANGDGVHFQGHDGALDLEFTDPHVVFTSATTAELRLDVEGLEYGGPNSGQPYNLDDSPVADLTLPQPTLVDGVYTWANASAVLTDEGVPAFAGFYTAGTALDAVSFSAPVAAIAPAVTVTGDTTVVQGEEGTVTVTGTGFLPNGAATNGTRPPLAGEYSGAYVVFGSFLPNWKPSASAPSTSRKVLEQKWALPAATVGTPPIAAAQRVALEDDGSFEVVLTVKEYAAALEGGNYGVYSYSGAGPVYAPYETFTPVTFVDPIAPTVTTQPLNASVVAGNGTVLTAAADGLPAPTVQWESRVAGGSWAVINGATAPTYSVPAAGVVATGTEYRAVFTNVAGSVESDAAALTVAPAATTTTVKFSANTIAYNSARSASVTVKAKDSTLVPSGSVVLTISGKPYKAKLSNGKAIVTLTSPVNVGSRPVSVVYTSNAADFTTSKGSTTVKVTKVAPKVTAKFAKSTVTTKQKARVLVKTTVPGSLKAKASKVKVQIFDGKKKIRTATLNSSGNVWATLPKLKAGTHKIKVKFVGNSNLSSKYSSVRTLKVK